MNPTNILYIVSNEQHIPYAYNKHDIRNANEMYVIEIFHRQ